jgi:hypothetical protein
VTDHPEDADAQLAPFPTALPTNPFPPLNGETEPYLDDAAADPVSDWNERADAHDLPTASAPVKNPLVALGRFAFPPEDAPDDEAEAARDRRWTSRVIIVATVVLLIFNAVSLQNWARQQPPGWLSTTVDRLADVWVEQIALLGADAPRQAVRDAYETVRDAEWAD